MFIQSCLQKTISNSQLIISIRTFKRFGEYVKGYGHEPKYYQGGISIFFYVLYQNKKLIFFLRRLSPTTISFERSTGLFTTLYRSKRMDFRSSYLRTE